VAGSISLEELVALNDEIAALVRSGVPLDLGLTGWGGDLSGRLGRIAKDLGAASGRGASLSESLAQQGDRLPPVYRAVVDAGMRAGRLPAALESLSTSARFLEDTRRTVGLAVLYPLVLVTLGYFLFWFVLTQTLPAYAILYDGHSPRVLSTLLELGRWLSHEVPLPGTGRVILAGWIPPLAAAALVFVWWRGARNATVMGGQGHGRWVERLPLVGTTVRDARLAAQAELLGLLVENNVPLDEAVLLAAECSADRELIGNARKMHASLAKGAVPTPDEWSGFPPLLGWLAGSGAGQGTFVAIAHHVADTYRRRVARRARWLGEYLPLWLIATIGGGVVIIIAVATILPFTELMQNIAAMSNNSLRPRP
jgi:type II secretory pathway component PulF